jgi:hypothetical protein
MMHSWLLAAHIVVLGYWLGSELVINSQYRFVTHRHDLDFAARDAVMDHLMDADQHVRYALILQLMLGVMLCAGLGLLPAIAFWGALGGGALWLALVELVHRHRKSARGKSLAAADRGPRYLLIAGLPLAALVLTDWPLWLRLKIALFAGIMLCGVGIRFALIHHFALWARLAAGDGGDSVEAGIRRTYWHATAMLMLLWVFIAAITVLAVMKP